MCQCSWLVTVRHQASIWTKPVSHADKSLWWRHNEHDSVSNHQHHDCLLNLLFGRRSKKTSKLRVTGLCAGNSPGTGEFPAQRASNTENVSIWWRHHVSMKFDSKYTNFHSRKCINKRRLQQNGDHFISERTYHAQSGNDIMAAHGTTLIQSNHSRVLSTRVQYFSVLYHFGASESHSYTALEDLCHRFCETIHFFLPKYLASFANKPSLCSQVVCCCWCCCWWCWCWWYCWWWLWLWWVGRWV